MGGPSRKVGSSSKYTRKSHKREKAGKFKARHIDQVWEDVHSKEPEEVHDGQYGPVGTSGRVKLDADLPGHGKHYCTPCSMYFISAAALADHEKEKPHKRRAKKLMASARPHSQRDADAAAGLGPPDNGPRLRSGGAAMVE